MTIAVCCVSPEGVVFGADSTASLMVPGGFHYLNHNQKIFEVGAGSSLAAMTWGLASLGDLSHRTQIALFADKIVKNRPKSVIEMATVFIKQVWPTYLTSNHDEIAELKALDAKQPFEVLSAGLPGKRTKHEEARYQQLKLGLVLGFCLGGWHPSDRKPCAYEIICDPLGVEPTPKPIAMGSTACWGAPKVFDRIVAGIDGEVKNAILSSGKWKGSEADLNALLTNHQLYLPMLPIRDAVDFVHSAVMSTIKTLKFSHLSQTCGGPIEIAVVTTDREFRWVRHKEWDVAIKEGHASWKL